MDERHIKTNLLLARVALKLGHTVDIPFTIITWLNVLGMFETVEIIKGRDDNYEVEIED